MRGLTLVLWLSVGCSPGVGQGPDAAHTDSGATQKAVRQLLQQSQRYREIQFTVLNASADLTARAEGAEQALLGLRALNRTPIVPARETDAREMRGQLEGLLQRLNLKATVTLAQPRAPKPLPKRVPAHIDALYTPQQVLDRHRFEVRLNSSKDAALLVDSGAGLERLFVAQDQKVLPDGRVSLVVDFPFLRPLKPIALDSKAPDPSAQLAALRRAPGWRPDFESDAEAVLENYRRVARRREDLDRALAAKARGLLAQARVDAFKAELEKIKASRRLR